MAEKLLKITYEGQAGDLKFNAYLRMPSQVYDVVRREIKLYLFKEWQLPETTFRIFWIDADRDEIVIINQNDYEIFLNKCESNMHLHVAPIVKVVKPDPNDPSNFIIHDAVECDSCGKSPLVGFRYKCIQCPDFDLCQNCEASHKHSEHMMVRMPTNNGPSVVESWVSGPGHCGRRSGRRHQRAQCPLFTESAQATSTAPETEGEFGGHKESRRERRHNRRHGGGVLSQFMEMMMNMPENNTPVAKPTTSTTATASNATKEEPSPSTPPAPSAEVATESTVKAEASNVQEISKPTEPVAAPRCPKDFPEPLSAQTETPKTGGGAATTPTTPVINLEHLSQIVPPEYMRAGIEIMNNFSEMFAKMIDPRESANYGFSETSTASSGAASQAADAAADAADAAAKAAAAAVNASAAAANANVAATAAAAGTGTLPKTPSVGTPVSVSSSSSTSTETSLENLPLIAPATSINKEQPKKEAVRRRSDSLDHDWQLIDNSGPAANTETLINLETSTPAAAAAIAQATAPATAPATTPNFIQLGEQLRQHINDEQQREQVTAHTQTSQVNTVTTSTSTTTVPTNSTGTSPSPPEEKRSVAVFHTDERINSAIHAMMAMGFSNEGAWLTQLLESVEGNIPAALDIMHSSQRSN